MRARGVLPGPRSGRPSPRVLVTCVVIATVVAGCAPGSSGEPGETAPAPKAVSTDVAKAGDVTLTVWDQEVRGGQDEQMERLNRDFQEKYPNVTIKRVKRSFDDLQKQLRLALSGDAPPDVVQNNQGYTIMGEFAKTELILPLDPYAEAYGWRDRYPKALLDANSVTPDGKTLGEGNLYGMSLLGEIVGIYYNKDKLRRLGLQPPQTWAEFEQALVKAKAARELPIAFGNLDKFPAIHNFGVIQDQTAGKEAVRDLFYGRKGAWTDAPNVAAAQKLGEWAKNGYLPENSNAIKYDDSPVGFGKGEGVFLIGGTWFAPDLAKSMKAKVGFMLPPGDATMGGQSLPFSVSAKSKHPDVAAAYIDFISSPQAMDIGAEEGNLPALKPPTFQPKEPLLRDVFAAWNRVNAADGLTPYLDNATPTFPDTLGGALQKVIGGKATAQEAMQEAQRDYAEFHQ